MIQHFELITYQQLIEGLIDAGYKILIAAIILAVGWVVGRVIGSLVRRGVSRLGADPILRRTAIGRALLRSGFTASEFSHALAKWTIYITAFLVALGSLGVPYISMQVEVFLLFLPTLLGAITILLLGFTLSDWVGELVKKGFTQEQRETLYIDFIGEFVKISLYFVTITIVLSRLGVDVTILYIFAQAFAWALAIIVGVASGIIVGWMLKDKVREMLQ